MKQKVQLVSRFKEQSYVVWNKVWSVALDFETESKIRRTDYDPLLLVIKHSVLTLSSFLLAVLQVRSTQQQLLHHCEIKKKTVNVRTHGIILRRVRLTIFAVEKQ
jgi:hypothetical protein